MKHLLRHSLTGSRVRWFLAVGVASCLYAALATRVSMLWPKSSDQAGYFDAGLAVLHGNWRLHGWVLTAPDFWTSDIVLSALLAGMWFVLGHPARSPFVMMFQPALMWTALVLSSLAVVLLRTRGRRARWGAASVLLTVLAFPLLRSPMAYFVTLSAIHVGTVIYGLWALHWADRSLTGRDRLPVFLAGGMVFLGTIGDPLMVFSSGGGIILFCLAATGVPMVRRCFLGGSVGCGIVMAKGVLFLNALTGGFTTEALESRFAPWEQLGSNVGTTLRSLLLVFGADPSGRMIASSGPECLRLGLVVLGGVAAVQALRQWQPRRGAHFSALLVVTAGLNVVALAASNRIALDGSPIAVARYLFPAWGALSCLLALWWGQRCAVLMFTVVALIGTLVADGQEMRHRSPGVLAADDQVLCTFLLQRAPPLGIGSWWSSVSLDIASLKRLRVLPGMRDGQGIIHPFVHIRPAFDWQALNGQRFFVLIPTPEETYTEVDVLRTFGLPAERYRVGRYQVFIYTEQHTLPRPG